MSISLRLITSLFPGALIFIFLYWRALREDYSNDILFSSALKLVLYILVGSSLIQGILGYFLPKSNVFNPEEVWFWGAIIGYAIGLFSVRRRHQMKIYEIFEASGAALLPWYSLVFLTRGLQPFNLVYVSAGFVVVLFFAAFVWLDRNYKKVPMFRLSRAGVVGMSVFAAVFFVRSVVAAKFPGMISIAGRVDVIPSAVVSFLLFFSVYNLSEI